MSEFPNLRDGAKGWKTIDLDDQRILRLHFRPITIDTDESFGLPADVTPRTSFLMKLYGQAQPIVRAWQQVLAGRPGKAAQIVRDGRHADEQIIHAICKWLEGEESQAENILRDALRDRKSVGSLFKKYSIPLVLEYSHFEISHHSSEQDNPESKSFIQPGFALFAVLNGVLAIKAGRPVAGFETIKGHLLLHPEEHDLLLGLIPLINEFEKCTDILIFFTTMTGEIEPASIHSRLILFKRAECQVRLNRMIPALFTLKKIEPQIVHSEFDRKITRLQIYINERSGKRRDASRYIKKLGSSISSDSEVSEVSDSGILA